MGKKETFFNSLHLSGYIISLFSPPVCAVAGLDELRLVEVGRGLLLNQAQ